MRLPWKPQHLICPSLMKATHSVSHMATNRLSHVDLCCCISQTTRFYRNQCTYFAHEVSGVYSYSRRAPSSSGKAQETPGFPWQTFSSFVKKKQQIFWCVTDAFIVANSPDKLLYWPEMTTLTCCLFLRIYRTADQTKCGHRERERWRQKSISQGPRLWLFSLVKSASTHCLSRGLLQQYPLS